MVTDQAKRSVKNLDDALDALNAVVYWHDYDASFADVELSVAATVERAVEKIEAAIQELQSVVGEFPG